MELGVVAHKIIESPKHNNVSAPRFNEDAGLSVTFIVSTFEQLFKLTVTL